MIKIQVFVCANCNKNFIQRKWICPECNHTEFHKSEIDGEGKVYSHTTIHVSSKEFEHLTPYTVALIDLANGLRVTGQMQEQVGMNDEVVCTSDDNGRYLFVKK